MNRAALPGEKKVFVALLGRRDKPTDAVHDYCTRLAEAIAERGHLFDLVRVEWQECGWLRSIKRLWEENGRWKDQWVLVQYTALAWSTRGFPLAFPLLVLVLKVRGVRVAVVYHDPFPFGGKRLRDRFRRAVQLAAMRLGARWADKVISTLPCEAVPWMRDLAFSGKAAHVPVGSNVSSSSRAILDPSQIPTVVVFGVTENNPREAALIGRVALEVVEKAQPLRLLVLGRGATEAEFTLRRLLGGSKVTLEVHGVLPAHEVREHLATAHAQLFVRSGVSSRRGTAIAGICCGLPVVGFKSSETGFPITEAGVRLVPEGDAEGVARELIAVLGDACVRDALSRRSLDAAQRYFCWEAIAGKFLEALRS